MLDRGRHKFQYSQCRHGDGKVYHIDAQHKPSDYLPTNKFVAAAMAESVKARLAELRGSWEPAGLDFHLAITMRAIQLDKAARMEFGVDDRLG